MGYEVSYRNLKPNRTTLKRYFEVFDDMQHRVELAYYMIKEAHIMNQHGVVCQFLWHPDSWYVLQTDREVKVMFAGHHLTLPPD